MTQPPLSPGFTPTGGPTRRTVVCGMAALAATAIFVEPLAVHAAATAAVATTAATIPAMPRAFLATSARLTGVALDQVSLPQANQIWAALVPIYGAKGLATVIAVIEATADESAFYEALQKAGVLDIGQAITRTWYTGSPDSQPKSVLFYDAALAWTVCAFTKPAANCGGLTGYWAQPWIAPAQETR